MTEKEQRIPLRSLLKAVIHLKMFAVCKMICHAMFVLFIFLSHYEVELNQGQTQLSAFYFHCKHLPGSIAEGGPLKESHTFHWVKLGRRLQRNRIWVTKNVWLA